MRFTIISTRPGHQPPQGSCDFYAPGGTIGRGTDNTLVLPDSKRGISRLQAIVRITPDAECYIINRGKVVRMTINDIPLERDCPAELQDGDVLGIDDYRIEVVDSILDTRPVSRLSAVTTAQTMAVKQSPEQGRPTAVPAEIRDTLIDRFSIADNISTNRPGTQSVAAPDDSLPTAAVDPGGEQLQGDPSGNTVLMQMFDTRMPGFMPPAQSVRDALLDLQAHQMGMIAGARAIIAAMLASFDPQRLEEEAKREGLSSRLARKAALWDYFVRRYGKTAREIDSDFHAQFGDAFLHAYEQEAKRYKDAHRETDSE